MSFRFVPKSVTVNDLERLNSPNGCVISQNSVDFWAACVKVVEDTLILSAAEMQAKECSFQQYITYSDIDRESALAKALK